VKKKEGGPRRACAPGCRKPEWTPSLETEGVVEKRRVGPSGYSELCKDWRKKKKRLGESICEDKFRDTRNSLKKGEEKRGGLSGLDECCPCYFFGRGRVRGGDVGGCG